MLVYFDPWLAGVVLPALIIVGPDGDPVHRHEPEGQRLLHVQGAQVRRSRSSSSASWCSGASLIVLGTFLRGPNWNFFGPYEFWDIHKLVPLNNINLSEIIWIKLLKRSMPNFWLFREIFGLALVGFYVAALPLVLSKTLLRRFFEKMDTPRYLIGVSLVPDDDVAADQDVPALDLQPEVHRRRSPSSSSTSRPSQTDAPQAARRADRSPLQHPAAEPRVLVDGGGPDGRSSSGWSIADYSRDWKTIQRTFMRLDAKLTREAALAARREGARRGARASSSRS